MRKVFIHITTPLTWRNVGISVLGDIVVAESGLVCRGVVWFHVLWHKNQDTLLYLTVRPWGLINSHYIPHWTGSRHWHAYPSHDCQTPPLGLVHGYQLKGRGWTGWLTHCLQTLMDWIQLYLQVLVQVGKISDWNKYFNQFNSENTIRQNALNEPAILVLSSYQKSWSWGSQRHWGTQSRHGH